MDAACAARVAPGQKAATTDADVAAWGFRGDPALKAKAVQIAGWHVPDVELVPLYAAELDDDRWVGVVAEGSGRPGAARRVWALTWWRVSGVPGDALDEVVAGQLPAPGAGVAVSMILRWRRVPPPPADFAYGSTYATNMLVVLAPPGSTGTTFQGCRWGRAFTVRGSGDTLVRDVGTLDAPGQLTVRTASGGVGYWGSVADLQEPVGRADVQLPPVEPIPVPQGYDQVFRSVRQGARLDPSSVSATRATVFIRCRTVMPFDPIEVSAGTKLLGAAKCDGSVEMLIESVSLSGALSVGRAGDRAVPPVSYQVIVVVPH